MHQAAPFSLSGWESFYVIIGSSAAALTGLMFVVIALTAETGRSRSATIAALRAWASPTVVHFGAVLLLSAVHTVPGHSVLTLGACVGGVGAIGLGFARWVVRQARRQTAYVPVAADWEWHVWWPVVAYSGLLVGAGLLWWWPKPALVVVGAAALFLLYVGIHNSWDAAVWGTISRLPADEQPAASRKG